MKLWLDDVRKPPDDTYLWCKTADDAWKAVLKSIRGPGGVEFEEWALDHDLGGALAHYGKGPYDFTASTGFDFLVPALGLDRMPKRISIHSTNVDGVLLMVWAIYQNAVRLEVDMEIVIHPMRGRIMDLTPHYGDR